MNVNDYEDEEEDVNKKLQEILAEHKAKKEIESDDSEIEIESEIESEIDEYDNKKFKFHSSTFADSDSDSLDCEIDLPNDDSNDQETINSNNELINIEKSLKLNIELMEKYKKARLIIEKKLIKCKNEIEEINLATQITDKKIKNIPYTQWTKVGMPYFKDSQMFSAPLNIDAKTKINKNELMVVYQSKPKRWSGRDRRELLKKIQIESSSSSFEFVIAENLMSDNLSIQKKSFNEIVGPLGTREFDWMKLSVDLFYHRHTAEELRVMWNVYLHPDISKKKWKTKEDNDLKRIANKYKHQNWDLIAEKLNTSRSGYQCFIRYNTILKCMKSNDKDKPWSKEENIILNICIDKLKIGDYIPWSIVVYYIDDRTKNQVYSHWKYSIDPTLKKGRFTCEEDQIILDGVAKYGRNYSKISTKLMPHRTSVQIASRFRLLLLKTDDKFNLWTLAEDKKLLELYKQHESQWSLIAKIMKKDRTYLRHRHLALMRYINKGYSLKSIPRKRLVDEIENRQNANATDVDVVDDVDDDDDVDIAYDSEMNKIDDKILEFIRVSHLPTMKPIGGQIKIENYYDPVKSAKELYNIFSSLSAKLEVPDDLNISELNDNDIDILTTYKKICQGTLTTNKIEEYRKKMFPLNLTPSTSNDVQHFIPPAPFGLYQNRNKKIIKNSNINSIEIDENFKYDLSMNNIETPNIIDEKIDDKEKRVFDKLSLLFGDECLKKRECKIENRNVLLNSNNKNDSDVDIDIDGDDDDDVYHEVTKKKIDKIWLPYDKNDNIIRDRSFFEPSLTTIIGFDAIQNMKKNKEKLHWSKNDIKNSKTKITTNGKRAFHTFRNRFLKLFKYPIGLANILPIEIGLPSDAQQDDDDDDDDEDQ
ncbi:snRNA-activating protein complex subunit 4 [Aphidius gifuensis]|uniref:snRNA-activating protein complex subunit 4 n=1 Tax=Aphidius gifuensis TaxID=684658 RepID=UPI001CDC868B|nr:snRNA-activating protein complex subunit 4 [Aphidius gifuensis]